MKRKIILNTQGLYLRIIKRYLNNVKKIKLNLKQNHNIN